MSTPKLILFDIDGTLILTGGAGRRALDRAFDEIFGVPRAFGGIPMAGRTDLLIIREACERHGVDVNGRLSELLSRYFLHLAEELPKPFPGKRILPGVVPLLEALGRDDDAVVALVTGNLATSARLKLQHFGIWQYFVTGAYGDEAPQRTGLVPVAVERVASLGYGVVPPDRIVVIGDTPHDVACAAAAGARSLAVGTGTAPVGELRAAGADVVVEDLSATENVLAAIESLLDAEPAGRE